MKATDVQQALREKADPDIAAHSQRFFKTGPGEYGEGDQFLGLRVPMQRKIAKRFVKLSLDEIGRLLQSPFHEERLTALLILTYQFPKANEEQKTAIYNLYLSNTAHINNWDLVDTSAEHIVGAYLKDRDRSILVEMARSGSFWERRIAIMATFHFIKHNEFTATLKISEILLKDRHDLIHKAVGWMLREIGKRDLQEEEAFLKQHYKKMPRTILRYAIEKFPEEKRRYYLYPEK